MQTELQRITSRDNERLKHARRVRDGKEDAFIFLEGVRLVAEAIRSRIGIDTLFVSSDARDRVADMLDLAGARITYEVADTAFQTISDTKTAQGLIALVERPVTGLDEIKGRLESAPIPVVVYLDRVNNPSNLGAVVRAAEASGAAGMIVSEGSADAFSPKALRAAMGSSLRVAIAQDVAFPQAVAWAKSAGLRTTAADIDGELVYSNLDWRKPRMLVMGSEAEGLSDEDRRRVDELTIIPMENKVESLNLAVACGVILFEARRQRG